MGKEPGSLKEFLVGEDPEPPWYHNPAYLLAGLAWVSLFALSWLMVLGEVAGTPALTFWVFFLIVAVGASSVGGARKPDGDGE